MRQKSSRTLRLSRAALEARTASPPAGVGRDAPFSLSTSAVNEKGGKKGASGMQPTTW
ncbi:MAG: hypothetical protein ABFD29_02640 [Anaerolineaceae bacterium]